MKTLLLNLTVLAGFGCTLGIGDFPEKSYEFDFDEFDWVYYNVSCTPAGFSATFIQGDGSIKQKDIENRTSWSTLYYGNSGDSLYISAQSKNENANISATITYKSNVINEDSSSGDFAMATASGQRP